jgi:hypothetical protein
MLDIKDGQGLKTLPAFVIAHGSIFIDKQRRYRPI